MMPARRPSSIFSAAALRLLATALSTLFATGLAALVPSPALAQGGPPPEVRAAVSAVLAMLESEGDAALDAFADERLAAAYRDSFVAGALRAHLAELRGAARGRTGDVAVEKGPGDELVLILGGGVRFLLALDDAAKLVRFERLDDGAAAAAPPGDGEGDGDDDGRRGEPVAWEALGERFAAAVEEGFSGVVLARRGGATVLHRAYGAADRASGRRNRLDTAFGIGSTPIDFTVTLAALLAERGVLDLDRPVGHYLAGVAEVPADKASLTARMILEGRSGLPDFHHLPSDWDADLAWVDRDAAVERILAQPLLFAPGSGEAHSHSAYGLLAALLETASGRSYRELVRGEILDPLGMERTGFYGETRGLGLDDFAVGYGAAAVGLPNIPPNWGPTSWLVMGSGGMFSTLGDLTRYHDALAAGRPISGPWARRQLRGVFVGGSERGYFYFRASDGEGDEVTFLMNGEGRDPKVRALTRELMALVMGGA